MKKYKQALSKGPEILEPLMEPHVEKLNEMLSPGLTLLRWTSLNLDHFAETVISALEEFELLVARANDLLTIQIEGGLADITSTLICDLPDTEPWTTEEFISRIQVKNRQLLLPHY